MTRRVPQRILLSFVCALALILIPLSYSSAWAQSTYPSTQQDRTDQNSVDQNQNKDLNQTQTQSNQDLNQTQSNQELNQTQSNQSSPDVNSSTGTRQKPDSSVNDPNTENQNQNQ